MDIFNIVKARLFCSANTNKQTKTETNGSRRSYTPWAARARPPAGPPDRGRERPPSLRPRGCSRAGTLIGHAVAGFSERVVPSETRTWGDRAPCGVPPRSLLMATSAASGLSPSFRTSRGHSTSFSYCRRTGRKDTFESIKCHMLSKQFSSVEIIPLNSYVN